ncbi:hypothetical protein [Heyndrickxia ginsengihumi]|uniref:hypothetical protein n=1 Tax=Heyndrickxia ginsengihumi TaxID=363870 RepID=UPI0004B2F643|nr:hypothetical protein [Heyndrickxia ginsengihumi]
MKKLAIFVVCIMVAIILKAIITILSTIFLGIGLIVLFSWLYEKFSKKTYMIKREFFK